MGVKKTFTRKNYGTLYKWSVTTGPQGRKKKLGNQANSVSPTFCTGYVYDQVIVNGQVERLLYVECGYVQ